MRWLKEHGLGIVDTLSGVSAFVLAYLSFYGMTGEDFPQFAPQTVVQLTTEHIGVVYVATILLLLWFSYRLFLRIRRRYGWLSKSEIRRHDEEFQSFFAKCPYWIKVFLKTVQDKDPVYSEANSAYFESYSQFLLQFIDYKTVGGSTWQYRMLDDAREYFDKHPDLLGDVAEEEVRRHALRSDERVIARMSTEFDWWYFSDADYIEPIVWSGSSNPFLLR